MSRTLKCDKMCKYVKISDKLFSLKRLKNTTETKTIKVIKNRPKQIILRFHQEQQDRCFIPGVGKWQLDDKLMFQRQQRKG